jgi:hypothetical protein
MVQYFPFSRSLLDPGEQVAPRSCLGRCIKSSCIAPRISKLLTNKNFPPSVRIEIRTEWSAVCVCHSILFFPAEIDKICQHRILQREYGENLRKQAAGDVDRRAEKRHHPAPPPNTTLVSSPLLGGRHLSLLDSSSSTEKTKEKKSWQFWVVSQGRDSPIVKHYS